MVLNSLRCLLSSLIHPRVTKRPNRCAFGRPERFESRLLLSRLFSFDQDEGFTRVNRDGAGARVASDAELGVNAKDGANFLKLSLTNVGRVIS